MSAAVARRTDGRGKGAPEASPLAHQHHYRQQHNPAAPPSARTTTAHPTVKLPRTIMNAMSATTPAANVTKGLSGIQQTPAAAADDAAANKTPSTAKYSTSGDKKKSTRKGKWTIEEEEFTTRIIEFFNSGLLELPEGTTLRSYLAEKLNCDPMRITKKFSGASCLGKRVFHASAGRQRDERMTRVASQQTLEAAQRELATLEARFVDAVSRSNESKDARMIDLEARFLHAANVVSTPAIDAFIMQSCGGSLWDPDGVASSIGRSGSSKSALDAATAAHLAVDPSAYAEGAVPPALARRYDDAPAPELPLDTPPSDASRHARRSVDYQRSLARRSEPQCFDYDRSARTSYYDNGNLTEYRTEYGQPYAAAPASTQVSASGLEARLQHLVKQRTDPNFKVNARASHSQHQADRQRLERWIAATHQGVQNNDIGSGPHLSTSNVSDTTLAVPHAYVNAEPAPAPMTFATPSQFLPKSTPPPPDAANAKVSNDTSEASGLLLGFVKSLRRSESHNDLVEFVEDVNERAAMHQKQASLLQTSENQRKRTAYTSNDDTLRKRQMIAPPAR